MTSNKSKRYYKEAHGMSDGQIKQMNIKNYSSSASNNAPEVSIVFILNFVVNQEKLVM